MHKRVKSSQNFEYLTEVPSSILRPEDRDGYELKEQYNRLVNENILKLAKIANLKRMVRNFERNSLGVCVKDEGIEPVFSINKKIQEKEEICQQEIAQQAILLHKKENLKISTEQLRGKLIELQNDFDKITVNYSAFTNSNFASKYTLLLSNKALEDYEKHVDQARSQFTQNIEKLEKRLKTASELNNRRLTKASSLDSELKTKQQEKQKFCKQFEQRIKEFKISNSNKKASLQSLDSYKKGFSFIRQYIQSESPETSNLSDLSIKVINKIIEKFNELEYKSESLNFTYEKMSEQEAKLNCELSKLMSELSILKIQSDSRTSPNLPKRSLPSLQKVYESEIFIIKNYFQIAEILYENFEKLTNFDKSIEDKLKNTILLLKSIRIGIQKRRPFNIERFLIEKIVGRHSYLETRLEIMNSMSLNKPELRSVYLSIFPQDHKNSELFIDYIESSPIIKTFLDKETLLYFLTNNSSKAFSELLQDLSLSCNLRLIEKLRTMLIESGHLLMILNKMIPDHINKAEFCKAHENYLMKHSINFSKINRTQSVSPYKITEKTHKKLQESADSSLPTNEKIISSQKKIPRLYNLSSTAISRQQVVKEVLENQKKETKLRTIEKKIAKNSEKTLNLPFMKKFILRSSTDRSSLYQSCKLKYL